MTQKLIQIGNSTGIIIPKALLELLGVQSGNEVRIERDVTTNSLIIHNADNPIKKSSLSPHFLSVLEKVNNDYGDALKELAQK